MLVLKMLVGIIFGLTFNTRLIPEWMLLSLNNLKHFFISDDFPRSCENECHCYSNHQEKVLVADCSHNGLTQIPQFLPNNLDWLIVSGNNIRSFDYSILNKTFMKHISKLDLSSNNISSISSEFIDVFIEDENLKYFDVSNNNLKNMPKNIQNVTSLKKLRIQGNQFQCECDNIWMKDWILSNTDLVDNYKTIECEYAAGKVKPIIQVDRVTLGCISREAPFSLWKILGKFYLV